MIETSHGQLTLLSVGIDSYGKKSGFHHLKTCSNDAEAIRDTFLNVPQLNADKDRLFLITSKESCEPSRGNILSSIKDLTEKSKDDDRLLFYFSGHGHKLVNNNNEKFYLVPQDAYDENDPNALIDFDEIIAMIDNSLAKHKIVIIDACFSGPTISGKKLCTAEYSPKSLEKHLNNTEGFVTICSSMNNQTSSSKSPNDKNSLFTYFLIKALEGEENALDKTKILTITSLYDYVNTEVQRTANSYQQKQTPIIRSVINGEIVIGIFSNDKDSNASNDSSRISKSVCDTYKLEISDSFSRKLNDPGASFSHPNKSNLLLDDIFVYPYLRDLTSDKDDNDNDNVNSQDLILLEEAENKILILGDQNSGKTSLCKMLYKELYNKGYVPIYITGSKINSKVYKNVDLLISTNISSQYKYKNESGTDFINSNKNRFILIIDDYDKATLNLKFKSKLLDHLSIEYRNIIIFTNDIYQVSDLVVEESEHTTFISNFKQYEILDFGHLLRYKLINKWNSLEKEEIIESKELISKNDRARLIIDTVIGKNFVPAYPFYILTLLQTIEAGIPHNLKESSYGYYYQCLITNALSKINKNNDEIDAYYNYITELSYYLFDKKQYELSDNEFRTFHLNYCKEYSITIVFDDIINNLLKSNILLKKEDIGMEDMFRFRYKYTRYFFTAKYLSNEISDESIKEKISFMCKNLHKEHFANIIMFLTHHSKDPFIVSQILINTKKLFDELEPYVFDKNTANINKLLDKIPKLVYENRSIEENREKKLKHIDNIENDNNWKDETIDKNETQESMEQLDIVSKFNLTFKTIEIIGQILKNYYGSLKGVIKNELVEESYFLGLRALNFIFTRINQNTENIVKQIYRAIEKRHIDDKLEIEKISRNLLFRICEFISYGFIKKISNSIGYERISESFKEVLGKNENISVSLVDISIKLDFYTSFPYDDLRLMNKTLTKYTLPYSLLRHMVINYLRMFPTTYIERQRICNLFSISMNDQRSIDFKSVQKKSKD